MPKKAATVARTAGLVFGSDAIVALSGPSPNLPVP
jgi:hypothetical protein